MAREKPVTADQPNSEEQTGSEPLAVMDTTPAPTPAGKPAGAVVTAPRTRDRDPADREQWKRDRAAALGIPRD
jgi:hypothetical protein